MSITHADHLPMIKYGSNFTGSIYFGYPLDTLSAYPGVRVGSEQIVTTSGIRDAWTKGYDQYLQGTLKWIPGSTPTTVPSASCWDGTMGVEEWLKTAQDQQIFLWYPNASDGAYVPAYLVEPMEGGVETSTVDASRALTIKMCAANPTASFTGY